MSSVEEELFAINAIYPEIIKPITVSRYRLECPPPSTISLELNFPVNYPQQPPTISRAHNISLGNAQKILDTTVAAIPGSLLLYDLIGKLLEIPADVPPSQVPSLSSPSSSLAESITAYNRQEQANQTPLNQQPPPSFFVSEPIVDRKSVFVGRAIPVSSETEAKGYLIQLLDSDKRVARASHNITAWRITSPSNPLTILQDNDDDGEAGAGSSILSLLQILDAVNVMVVVSRWYGGVELHADRFKHIRNVARDALDLAGFIALTTKSNGSSKRKSNRTRR